jgi:hypothetical protein
MENIYDSNAHYYDDNYTTTELVELLFNKRIEYVDLIEYDKRDKTINIYFDDSSLLVYQHGEFYVY